MDTSGQDLFDRLPDDVVLSVFDKLHDAKSLSLSMSVCKRFRTIAPQVLRIYLPVPHKKPDQDPQKPSLRNLLLRTLIRPITFISQIIKPKPKHEDNDLDFYSHYVPNRILKPFHRLRSLHLKLPCNGYQKPGGPKRTGNNTALLKWKAEFGGELKTCVILGARSWSDGTTIVSKHEDTRSDNDRNSVEPVRFLADDDLKLRIVWTISCLIAASARHYLVQETVRAIETIESVEVSDESEQGRLCMNREQIEELKGSKGKIGEDLEHSRSRVPALRMKMWYLERMEVAGKVMEGATLVVIRPSGVGGPAAGDVEMVEGAFGEEEGVDEAVRKLMVAKKCYTLEINSF